MGIIIQGGGRVRQSLSPAPAGSAEESRGQPLSRRLIDSLSARIYSGGTGNREADRIETVHNYIGTLSDGAFVVRKGAVSAKAGETLIIPMNMRDGVLLCRGKGNPDWNESAPHGAGRRLSRKDAKETLSMDEYRDSMRGIFSSSVGRATLDESPMAYKPTEEILTNVRDTVEVLDILKPVYNFKAGGED